MKRYLVLVNGVQRADVGDKAKAKNMAWEYSLRMFDVVDVVEYATDHIDCPHCAAPNPEGSINCRSCAMVLEEE